MRRKSTCAKQRRDGNKDGHEKLQMDSSIWWGVRKEGEENLAPEEAIERLKTEGEANGEQNKSIEIAEKMKAEGFDNALIEKLTGILLH